MNLEEIPFDADCIDEQMIPTAFTLDTKEFQINSTKDTCFEGKLYGQRVIFSDPNDQSNWMNTSYSNLLDSIGHVPVAGWHVHDSSPTNEEMKDCPTEGPKFIPRNMDMSHSLCFDNWIPSTNSTYTAQHSHYSLQFSKRLSELTPSQYQYTDTYQIAQASIGGFLGSHVPSTWSGLAASLREVLMLGLAGQSQVSMPACGTMLSKELDKDDLGLLCLRWFQLAAYMPSLRSWYKSTDDKGRMPYQLKEKTYRNYITWALEKRYKMLPYLRTLQKEWSMTSIPMVRPMFLEFPSSEFIGLWEQFMVGPDLVVAPR